MDTNVHTPQAMFFNPIRYEIPPFQRSDLNHAFKLWPTTHDQEAFRHAMHNALV